jgi:hypothetical protein
VGRQESGSCGSGKQVEIAALDVAQDHADRRDGLGACLFAFDGDADSEALQRCAEGFEFGLGGVHGLRAFQGVGDDAKDSEADHRGSVGFLEAGFVLGEGQGWVAGLVYGVCMTTKPSREAMHAI